MFFQDQISVFTNQMSVLAPSLQFLDYHSPRPTCTPSIVMSNTWVVHYGVRPMHGQPGMTSPAMSTQTAAPLQFSYLSTFEPSTHKHYF